AGRNPHQAFEDMGDVGAREAEITMAALLLDVNEAGILKLAEMPARSRKHHARFLGEFGCGERLAVHERSQHVGARRISQQRRNGGDVRSVFHSLTLAELSMPCKLLGVALRKARRHRCGRLTPLRRLLAMRTNTHCSSCWRSFGVRPMR